MNSFRPGLYSAVLILAGTAPLSAHDGEHGGGDDTTKFNTADLDLSASLTPAEFSSTFSTLTPRGQITKAFKKADGNRNGSLTLEEWLAYREGTFEHQEGLKFDAADTDVSGFLSLAEFAPTQPDNKPFIMTRAAFLGADHDDDGLISPGEWLEHRENGFHGSHGVSLGKFDLADLDGSGGLTPDEFAGTYPPKVKAAVVLKKFASLDDSDDGLLTRDEWNPGNRAAF